VVWQGSAGDRRPYADQTAFGDTTPGRVRWALPGAGPIPCGVGSRDTHCWPFVVSVGFRLTELGGDLWTCLGFALPVRATAAGRIVCRRSLDCAATAWFGTHGTFVAHYCNGGIAGMDDAGISAYEASMGSGSGPALPGLLGCCGVHGARWQTSSPSAFTGSTRLFDRRAVINRNRGPKAQAISPVRCRGPHTRRRRPRLYRQ